MTDFSSSQQATPRWVKIFGIIAIVVIVLFVLLHLSGGGMAGMH